MFSPFCAVLPTTAGASQSFPEVMVGGGVAGEVLTRSGVPADDKTKIYGCPNSHISHTVLVDSGQLRINDVAYLAGECAK